MAHTKAQKTAKGNKDSQPKRLGVKIYGDQKVAIGNIIIRQRGNKFWPGLGTKQGRDDTIYAVKAGYVRFIKKQDKHFVTVVATE